MNSVFRSGAVAVCLAVLAACSAKSLITGGELVRAGEPTGTITVLNGTRGHLDVITISECSASTYGVDRLPDGVSVGPGQGYSFTVSAGCWDVDAGAVGVGEARQRLSVAAGGTTEYTVTD